MVDSQIERATGAEVLLLMGSTDAVAMKDGVPLRCSQKGSGEVFVE